MKLKPSGVLKISAILFAILFAINTLFTAPTSVAQITPTVFGTTQPAPRLHKITYLPLVMQ